MCKYCTYGLHETTDGAGLFCGIIKHLLNRGEECPIVFAATHFHEVLNEEMLSPTQVPISFVHMAVLFTTGDGDILSDHNSSMLGSRNSQDYNTELKPGDGVTYLFKYVD
jgi:DNA mismatch repair protein MSH5